MLVIVKGAGDIATGIAIRLFRAGFPVVMTEIQEPLCVRRTVSFCEAVRLKKCTVEGVCAEKASSDEEIHSIIARGNIPVVVDPEAQIVKRLAPDAVIDAILAKKNLGTSINDASVVIGVGPGFFAGRDCHAVIETKRGHTLGRAIYQGEPIPNTGVPGNIGGYTTERVLRAPCDGIFHAEKSITDIVEEGEVIGKVDKEPVIAEIAGVLRGLIADGLIVERDLKIGDIDPRTEVKNCYTCSDKALSVAGGVLEALCGLLKEKGRMN